MIDTRKNIKYMRLSLEDDEVDGVLQDESNSITSQRHILRAYPKLIFDEQKSAYAKR